MNDQQPFEWTFGVPEFSFSRCGATSRGRR
jgi:hypothetical protein